MRVAEEAGAGDKEGSELVSSENRDWAASRCFGVISFPSTDLTKGKD